MQRRKFLHFCTMALLMPISALAQVWNKPAFQATSQADAVKGMDIDSETESNDIEIIAPDFAENGAVVQVEVKSNIVGTEAIAIFVEKNPTPLIANYLFSDGALPHVITRIKMAETSPVQATVKVGNQYYKTSKIIEVSLSGCG